MARRKPGPPRGDKKPGLVAPLIARPSPVTAFVTGLLIFTPSVTFIAIQVIATAQASDAGIAAALAIVVGIYVLGVWVPYLLYLIAPEPTTRRLKSFDGWLRAPVRSRAAVRELLLPPACRAHGPDDHPRRMMCLTTAVRSVCLSTLTTGHVSALIRRAAVRSGRDAVPNWTVQPGVPARDRTEPIVGPHRRRMP